jgi:hypothetical protein
MVEKFIFIYAAKTENIKTCITELIELSKLNPAPVRHKTADPKKPINGG